MAETTALETTERKVRRTLYGSSSANTCAYFAIHKCSLTPRQMENKKCLAKQCTALVRAKDHPFWGLREERKAKRLERKQRLERMYAECTGGER